MGIKIFYILSVVYGIISCTGFLRRESPVYLQYGFLLIIALFFLYYANKRKIEFLHTVIGGVIVNISVQLTGGVSSPLFLVYLVIMPVMGYKEKYTNYWIIALCLFGAELLSTIFSHQILIPQLAIFAAAILILGLIIEKRVANALFLKKSLIKYESRDDFFSPTDIEQKNIVTSVRDIDKHPGLERPLLFFVRLMHNMFDAYTTAIFSCSNNYLTLIQGFSHSELFDSGTVIDLKSGIYRQIISSRKPVLIKEFVQSPDELGYYKGEIKISSIMIAPIVLLNQVDGVLVIDKKAGQFSEEDKARFTEACKSVGLLLTVLKLYERKFEEAKSLRVITDHVEALHKGLELKQILPNAINIIRALMKCNDVTIASTDELNNVGEVLESTYVKESTKFPLDDGLVGFIARHRNFIIKEDLSKGNLTVFKKGTKTRNLSFIGVPILQDDSLLGVIWLEDHRKKNFNEDNARALTRLASQLSLAWQRSILHNKIKDLSEKDGLTGLYNHRLFQELLEREIDKDKELVLIFFDIDHFKEINDTYGHQAGDRVLEFLGRLVKNTGIAARYGGEEFAIILPKYSLNKGIRVASSIKDHLLKSEINFNQSKIKITVSMGVAHYPKDAKTKVDLIESADKALYIAKKTGRDKIVVAQTMNEKGGLGDQGTG